MTDDSAEVSEKESLGSYLASLAGRVVGRAFPNSLAARVGRAKLPEQPISRAKKLELEKENRKRLENDLKSLALAFTSRPRVVELQLSNFCNMSCTMCYDGENPKLQKLDDQLVLAIAEDLFPAASVFIPFATSEPLIVTWDITKKLAAAYQVELELTTNVQFLDEKKFAELEPHVGVIEFSIDSHNREIYESIRLNSRPDKVFRNLPIAAKLCRDAGIEVYTNVVFMIENAPFLDKTVAFLADQGIPSVHIQRLFYNKPRTYFSDPVAHMSREWIEWMKEKIRAVAKEKKIKVALDFDGHELIDHLPPETRFRDNRTRDPWLETLRRRHPGYCPQSIYRLKVNAEGNAYPCCVGTADRLKLGNINESPLEDVWNGPTNRDLRRAMLTQDLPSLCRGCNFRTGPILGEVPQLPFNDEHFIWMESHPERWRIPLFGPDHLARLEAPPVFKWGPAPEPVDFYELVISVGGETVEQVIRVPADQTSFAVPAFAWRAGPKYTAFWWTVYGVIDREGDRSRSYRGKTVRAVIRHEDWDRIRGSTLDYDSVNAH